MKNTQQKPNNYDCIIIGFGVSGITTAIELSKQNKSFVIFESRDTYGGCWNDALETSELQTDRIYYKFDTIDYDSNVSRFPKKHEMLDYLRKAIDYFNLLKHVIFNSYAKINQSNNRWLVTARNSITTIVKHYNCDHLLFCGGKNTQPRIPMNIDILYRNNNINNTNNTTNTTLAKKEHTLIFHSKHLNTFLTRGLSLINKRIIIVGNGASGCDIVNYIYKKGVINSETKTELSILYKSNKYFVRKYIGGIPGSFILSRPFMSFFEKCNIKINNFLILLANIFIFKNYLDLPTTKINSSNIVGTTIINDLLLNNSKLINKNDSKDKSKDKSNILNDNSIDKTNNLNDNSIDKTNNLNDNSIDKTNILNDNSINNKHSINNLNDILYLKEELIEINSVSRSCKTNKESILTDIDLIVFATGYTTIFPLDFDYLYNYIIPVDLDFIVKYNNIAFIGYNPSYNFIANARRKALWYLDYITNNKNTQNNKNNQNTNNKNNQNTDNNSLNSQMIKEWITKTKKRKEKNNLDFMDCTYELFE